MSRQKGRTFKETSASPTLAENMVSDAVKREIGRRIYERMVRKRWRQADIRRATGLTADSISTYIRGTVMPNGTSLQKLARAFGCKVEDLVPGLDEPLEGEPAMFEAPAAANNGAPLLEMRVDSTDPRASFIHIRQRCSTNVATEIVRMLSNDKIADRKGSG